MQTLFTTLEEYREQRYQELEIKLLERTAAKLGQNFSRLRADFFTQLNYACIAAQKAQIQEKIPCGYISLSFLRTSQLEGNPEWQIDFYDKGWVYGEPWHRERFGVAEIFVCWDDFCREALDDKYFVRSRLQPGAIKAFFHRTLEKLVYLYAGVAKYFFRPVKFSDLPALGSLTKESDFFITCGEYLDWQERLYGERPPIDLLDIPLNEDVTFREFTGEDYSGEKLAELNLAHSRFGGCHFRKMDFSEVNFADTFFEECNFLEVNFHKVNLAGVLFRDCRFRDCLFTECGTTAETDEYFAPGEIERSKLTNVEIEKSDMTNFQIKSAGGENVTLKETTYNAADWEGIVHG